VAFFSYLETHLEGRPLPVQEQEGRGALGQDAELFER
jgi:hypothetical protein